MPDDLVPPPPPLRQGPSVLTIFLVVGCLGVFGCVGVGTALWFRIGPCPAPNADALRGGLLEYEILYPAGFKGNRGDVAKRTAEVVKARLTDRGTTRVNATILGDDRLSVDITGLGEAELDRCEALLAITSVEFREVAPRDVQRRWRETGKVPAGWTPCVNDRDPGGSYDHLDGKEVLIASAPIVEGCISNAQALQQEGMPHWSVRFDLTADGEHAFNAAAERLYRQEPPGVLAILKDGRILSKPVVMTPSFGSGGQIAGQFSRREAEDMAATLRGGRLPMPIGRSWNGKAEAGVPVRKAWVDLSRR